MRIQSKKVIAALQERRKSLFWVLACMLFASTALYVYYVNTAALNTVRWEEAAKKTAAVEANVSNLESSYLNEKRKVTLALAANLGFTDAKAVTYLKQRPVEVSAR